MATKIFDAEALVAGTLISDSIDDVGNLVIDFEIDGLSDGKSIHCLLTGKEDAASTYKPITQGDDKSAITFSRTTDGSFRQAIVGVDCNFARLEVTVPSGVSGSITAWITKTDNPNT